MYVKQGDPCVSLQVLVDGTLFVYWSFIGLRVTNISEQSVSYTFEVVCCLKENVSLCPWREKGRERKNWKRNNPLYKTTTVGDIISLVWHYNV